MLRRELGEGFAEIHEEGRIDGRVGTGELLELLSRSRELVAVSSHHFHGEDFEAEKARHEAGRGFTFYEIILIRHPVSRLVSIYNYYRMLDDPRDPAQQEALRRPFRGFVEFLLEEQPFVANDMQVVILGCNGRYDRPPDRGDLGAAVRLVTRATLCGTVERYDETMVAGEYFLRGNFGCLRLHYEKVNVSRKFVRWRPGEEGVMDELLGRPLHRHLVAMNALDLELWRAAERELERRIGLVWRFPDRLVEFQERVRALAAESRHAALA